MTLEGLSLDAQVNVYDMLGRQVCSKLANSNTTVQMPAMTQGVYTVSVNNIGGNTTFKVVVK
jgi:hypothetical protein